MGRAKIYEASKINPNKCLVKSWCSAIVSISCCLVSSGKKKHPTARSVTRCEWSNVSAVMAHCCLAIFHSRNQCVLNLSRLDENNRKKRLTEPGKTVSKLPVFFQVYKWIQRAKPQADPGGASRGVRGRYGTVSWEEELADCWSLPWSSLFFESQMMFKTAKKQHFRRMFWWEIWYWDALGRKGIESPFVGWPQLYLNRPAASKSNHLGMSNPWGRNTKMPYAPTFAEVQVLVNGKICRKHPLIWW